MEAWEYTSYRTDNAEFQITKLGSDIREIESYRVLQKEQPSYTPATKGTLRSLHPQINVEVMVCALRPSKTATLVPSPLEEHFQH